MVAEPASVRSATEERSRDDSFHEDPQPAEPVAGQGPDGPTIASAPVQSAAATLPWERSALLILIVAAVVAAGWQLAGPGQGTHGVGESTGEQPSAEEPSQGQTHAEPSAEEPSQGQTEPSTPPEDPIQDRWPVDFSTPTETVATFNNRSGDLLAVDLDTGRWAQIPLPDSGFGNRGARLWRVGDELVGGSGRIWAVSPGADEPTSEVGEADLSLPDTEPDRVWLLRLQHGSGNGHTSGMSTELTLVHLSGEILASATIHDRQPVRAVPGGLALRDRDGVLARFNLASGDVEAYLSDQPATVAHATRDHVAWCENPCETLRITGPTGETDRVIDDRHIDRFDVTAIWLSPEGDRVAAATVMGPGHVTGREIRVYQTFDGELLARASLRLGAMYGDWREDSRQFFYWLHASNTPRRALAEIGRWSRSTQIEQFDVKPHGTALGHLAAFPADVVDERLWTASAE